MAEKLNSKNIGLSLASIAAIFYIACAILFAIAPQIGLKFFSYIFHGIDITKIAATPVAFGSTIIGLIEIIIYSFVTGWLFAIVYNKLNQ